MQAVSFFRKCAELEKGFGDLYRRLAALYPEHPEVAELFKHTALEEDNHFQLMSLMARLVLGLKDGVALSDEAENEARKMEENLKKVNRLLDAGKTLSVVDALAMAIRIESSTIEAYGHKFLQTSNEELKKTIDKLTRDTSQHKLKFTAAYDSTRSSRPA